MWREPIGISNPAGAVVVGEHRDADVAAIGDTGRVALAGSRRDQLLRSLGKGLWRRDLDRRSQLNSIIAIGKAQLIELPAYDEDATIIETLMTEEQVARRVDDTVASFSVSTGKSCGADSSQTVLTSPWTTAPDRDEGRARQARFLSRRIDVFDGASGATGEADGAVG